MYIVLVTLARLRLRENDGFNELVLEYLNKFLRPWSEKGPLRTKAGAGVASTTISPKRLLSAAIFLHARSYFCVKRLMSSVHVIVDRF